ncbi:MAG: hypothetical protein ACFCUP_11950 [Actinomycetales bacterium]
MNVIDVINVSEPDVTIRFDTDGQSRLFGRDDDVCDIVVWSALCDPSLSRVAGRLWRMEGELWLRNLSSHHELVVAPVGEPTDAVLPPRRDPAHPGAAHCLPQGTSVVLGPGGCELVVTQSNPVQPSLPEPLDERCPPTQGVPELPEHLVDVALALCEPLLRGLPTPATYRRLAERLGIDSHKRIRLLVGELCDRYGETAAPYLRHSGELSPARDSPGARRPRSPERTPQPVLSRGVWRFDHEPDEPDEPDGPQPPAELPLPRYVPVAQLLVRRGLVRLGDLPRLDDRDGPRQPCDRRVG